MSTYSVVTGSGVNAYPYSMAGIYEVQAKVDFSTINSGSGTVQNDIIQLIQVPANTLVLGLSFAVTTVSSNMADFDLGDGDVTDGYVDGASMATVNDGCSWQTTFNEATPNTTKEGMSLGKFYTTADTIDLKQNTNATVVTGVLKVKALLIDMNIY